MAVRSESPEPIVTPEVLELLERATAIPRGLAFVHQAPVDCVAVTLGMHPRVVEQACDCLDHAEQRKMLIRHFVQAAERRRSMPAPPSAERAVESRVDAPTDPEQLIESASRHSLGVRFLVCAPLETAAIMFRVHPLLVLRARELLASRGVVPEDGDE
ncbi:MAG: hypothetical protein HYV09_05590 [Deltaproteobacteria bacterium]|nr:hypothetical protein [Deltaproteobacteria bacterium]